MAGWFKKLMHKDGAPLPPLRVIAGTRTARPSRASRKPGARDARYDAVIQRLREREEQERHARERRQRWYSQDLRSEPGGVTRAAIPVRLNKFRTKVPCRITPEARALLDGMRKQFAGCSISFRHDASRRQAVLLTGQGTETRQIGWVEHSVATDPAPCRGRDRGLVVAAEGGMLALQFRYPRTPARVASAVDAEQGTTHVDFSEIRPALDLRASDKTPSPRLVWVTRPEAETMDAVRSADYESFYVRFKREVLAGIWSALSSSLSTLPDSQWHGGAYYSVVRHADATIGKIYERTVDDSGRAADVGANRIYDAFAATDILLLYLDEEILADLADISFTLQSLPSTDAYYLKEEFFSVIRRYWATAQSLASRFGSDHAAVVRMSQRTLPMHSQAALLRQDWMNVRQCLFDRYGKGGRRAVDLLGRSVHRNRTAVAKWPFAAFPAGEVNVGLRLVYRQEWQQAAGATSGDDTMSDAVHAAVDAMKCPIDSDGCVNTGVRALAVRTELGLEAECRESIGETAARLNTTMRRLTRGRREALAQVTIVDDATGEADDLAADEDASVEAATADGDANAAPAPRTRLAEVQNVVLVAEKLPAPGEIDLEWVRRYDWILSKALLDESFRDALLSIADDASPSHADDEVDRARRQRELDAKRDRLCEHVRANVLHYQRAIWRHEDPHQRAMRYRKAARKVPLDWRFEIESGGSLTIGELADRLAGTTVDAQFAAYATGRDVDLDQLIDPAAPLGYYGNYAIYQMRPEFADEDLFSMLHFFKSPYVRANRVTGALEVVDPATADSYDDLTDLPARATEVHPLATVERMSPVVGERGTEDALMPAAPAAAQLAVPPHGYQLMLETAPRQVPAVTLSAAGPAAIEAGWSILRADPASSTLTAGVPVVVATGPNVERLILPGSDRQPLALVAGSGSTRPQHPPSDRVIVSGREGKRTLGLLAGVGGTEVHERVIVARRDEVLRPSLIAG